MKKLYTLIAAVLLTATVWAQSPNKMSYQAVIRDANNELVTSQGVGMQISILQGASDGSSVYTETQSPTTNANGLVTLEIGMGNTADDFSAIDWASGPYFIRTETDPSADGGTNYTIRGTSQLMSVPYALYAATSGSSTPGPQGEVGPQGLIGLPGVAGATGDQGPIGADGAIGATGPAASSLWTLNGSNIDRNTGNVGINESAPTHKLTINNSVDNSVLRLIGPGAIYGYNARLNFGDNDYVYLGEDTDDNLTINATRIALMGDAIGVGTTTPTEQLEVNGSIKIIDGTEGAGKVLTSDANGKGAWENPVDNVILTGVIARGALPIGATCPVGGSYTANPSTLEPGIYMYTLYSCPGQIAQVVSGFNINLIFISGTGDASNTWHNFNEGSCGDFYTGVVRVTTTSSVAVRYTSSSGSSFTVPGANTETVKYWKIN